MQWLAAIKSLLLLIASIRKLIIRAEVEKLKDIKEEALKDGDQRAFEKAISDIPNDVSPDKYTGMYERPVKKKP